MERDSVTSDTAGNLPVQAGVAPPSALTGSSATKNRRRQIKSGKARSGAGQLMTEGMMKYLLCDLIMNSGLMLGRYLRGL